MNLDDRGVKVAGELRAALDRLADDLNPTSMTQAVEALSSRYRAGGPARDPILSTPARAGAYAVYRMPATFAAAASALRQAQLAWPHLSPDSVLDLGGGTGAATWAATAVFPDLSRATVVDQVQNAIELGHRLTRNSTHPTLRRVRWRQCQISDAVRNAGADLVALSYVLGELTETQQHAAVSAAAQAGKIVMVVEPGTPSGYQRIVAARQQLIEHGLVVVAPCPHQQDCPLHGVDWCHFAVRVQRSALHRHVKRGELGYEDEKFSYVVAAPARSETDPPVSRILRHPIKRKGLVQLQLCQRDGISTTELVSKRQGKLYRAARDAQWGDTWPG
jgi:ribosomal protein RSM22 (predicted rRNA methylase)